MPDDARATQGAGGAGGPGDGSPSGAVQAETPGAKGPTSAAPQGGSPEAVDWKAKYEEAEQRRGSMQSEFEKRGKLLEKASGILGPPDETDWDQYLAETQEPEGGAAVPTAGQAAQPPGTGAQAQQMPGAGMSDAVYWNWANENLTDRLRGHTSDGTPVAGGVQAAREFAEFFGPSFKARNLTPPWEGMFGVGQQATPPAPQPKGNYVTEEQVIQLWNRREGRAEDVEDGMEALGAKFADVTIGEKSLMKQEVELQSGKKTTLDRALREFCYDHAGVTPEQALMLHFTGYWEKAREAQIAKEVIEKLRTEQATAGEPSGRASMSPFPQAGPDKQKIEAFRRAGEGEGGVSLEPSETAAQVVWDPQERQL